MRVSQYVSQERAIRAADTNGIRERWLFGLRVLNDPDLMSPGGGGLRHGVLAQLVEAAAKRGMKLSEREVRRRIQCARAYPTEAQIGHAVADFRTWRDLSTANFPEYEVPAGEPLADWRTDAERKRANAAALLDHVGQQGVLFPLSDFEPATTTLKDLVEYAAEQAAITERFAARDTERADYLKRLLVAVGADLSATWEVAHRAAFGEDVPE